MQKPRKIPQRMCCGCMQHKDKRDLIRVVKSPEGIISIDKTGKKAGRGAYICPDLACLTKAQKARRLERTFGAPVPDEVFSQLQKELCDESTGD